MLKVRLQKKSGWKKNCFDHKSLPEQYTFDEVQLRFTSNLTKYYSKILR